MNKQLIIETNDYWNIKKNPFFSVITPVYNRRELLTRLIETVKNQSFKDFEYIIVNDGSTEDLDTLVLPFLKESSFPVMYIKKPNGGVHTARNAGISKARGYLSVLIDSDDELMSNALESFYNAWQTIPEQDKDKYFRVAALCVTEKGIKGQLFPENINSLPIKKAAIQYERHLTEIFHADKTSVLKENPWPEPEGITFVTESIIWFKLLREYRVLCINEFLRVYHTEGDDHVFVNGKAKSTQYIKNIVWSYAYFLNNWKERKTHLKNYSNMISIYCVLSKVLKKRGETLRDDMRLNHLREKLLAIILFIPSSIIAIKYNNRK